MCVFTPLPVSRRHQINTSKFLFEETGHETKVNEKDEEGYCNKILLPTWLIGAWIEKFWGEHLGLVIHFQHQSPVVSSVHPEENTRKVIWEVTIDYSCIIEPSLSHRPDVVLLHIWLAWCVTNLWPGRGCWAEEGNRCSCCHSAGCQTWAAAREPAAVLHCLPLLTSSCCLSPQTPAQQHKNHAKQNGVLYRK